MELLPSGVKMHLRGFMTFHSVQINLDWVWPYWIEKQFDPGSRSFIPRAMNLTHVNQTQRNWTAVGVLGGKVEPIVDPRGLLTPWFDGWSLDVWIHTQGRLIAPSQLGKVIQFLHESLPIVITTYTEAGLQVTQEVWGQRVGGRETAIEKVRIQNVSDHRIDAKVYFSVRPYNPEGMSLIQKLEYHEEGFLKVNNALAVVFQERPNRVSCSDQRVGDVSIVLPEMEECHSLDCEAGMATSIFEYQLSLEPQDRREYGAICTTSPVKSVEKEAVSYFAGDMASGKESAVREWEDMLSKGLSVSLPDAKINECFRANSAFLHLFDDGDEITPGPLTYHRFWFRDAAFLINALDKLGYSEQAKRKLVTYPGRQRKDGFFISQNGEWDANGEALWTLMEHYRLTRDRDLLEEVYPSIRKGIAWIRRKRKKTRHKEGAERGLLPAGLSAEHLGPNDYYYWDNFWSLAGIRDGIEAAAILGKEGDRTRFEALYSDYWNVLRRSLDQVLQRMGTKIIPASPFRRMDAGAIGSISAVYPLRLLDADDEWIVNTVDYLRTHSFLEDGFFQNMVHSGVNPYLTAHIAQCYIYRRDCEAWPLIRYLLKVATPTFTWPEAIHPLTGGGCMGDGHHGWAAAEFILLVRNLLFFEEKERLVLTPIFPPEWYREGATIEVERAPTFFGPMNFRITCHGRNVELLLDEKFWTSPAQIEWCLPFEPVGAEGDAGGIEVRKNRVLLPAETHRVEVRARSEQVVS
jgi:hypothetical protein